MAGAIADRYAELATARNEPLDRARALARLTLPWVQPPLGHNATQTLPQSHTGFGARCVTNLASVLMKAILPPGRKGFLFGVSAAALARAGVAKPSEDQIAQLIASEDIAQSEIERRKWRSATYMAMLYLIVAGNVCEVFMPDNSLRYYRLDHYVVIRDGQGREKEVITHEMVKKGDTDEALHRLFDESDEGRNGKGLYTQFVRDTDDEDSTWTVTQELDGNQLNSGQTRQQPVKAHRWIEVIGEDYGRSKVEMHWADFQALDGLSKSLNEGAAMASRHLTLIRPNASGGLNLRRRVVRGENGDVIIGNPEDIAMLNFENVNGSQITAAEAASIRQELGAAFLLHSAMRRDAERVTAFEVQQTIEEIENVLGGTYTFLAQSMSEFRLRRLVFQMQRQGTLPDWPDGVVEPAILTGLEALSRERELERTIQTLQTLQALPPEILEVWVKWPTILGKIFNGTGIEDAVNTPAEAQAIMQRRVLEQVAQRGGEQLAQNAADAAVPQQQ